MRDHGPLVRLRGQAIPLSLPLSPPCAGLPHPSGTRHGRRLWLVLNTGVCRRFFFVSLQGIPPLESNPRYARTSR